MKKQKDTSSRKDVGFTLIEMLIVVTIIGILAAIVMPRFLSTSETAKKNAHKTDRQNMNAQIELFHFNTGTWPQGMDSNDKWNEPGTPGSYADYFPDDVPSLCNQTANWVVDAVTNRIATAGHETHE